MFVVRAFYHFVDFPDFADHRSALTELTKGLGMAGTILLAPEGINSTISGTQEAMDTFWSTLTADSRFQNVDYKDSFHEIQPFRRMLVKLKKEIITIREPLANPNVAKGEYVTPEEWDALISDPDVILVDTRNDYEFAEGTFKGAVNPKTNSFGEFPKWVDENLDPAKHKKVAMFCTGGIRCEKASAYMLAKGFEEVYHLRGGILKYLEDIPEEQSSFEGACYIFDHRGAIVSGLKPVDRKFLDEREQWRLEASEESVG